MKKFSQKSESHRESISRDGELSGKEMAQEEVFRLEAVRDLKFKWDGSIEAEGVKQSGVAGGPVATNRKMGLAKWEWSLGSEACFARKEIAGSLATEDQGDGRRE
jgi:hypothetical protein